MIYSKILNPLGRPSFSSIYWFLTPFWVTTQIEMGAVMRSAELGFSNPYTSYVFSFWSLWVLLGIFLIKNKEELATTLFFACTLIAAHLPWGTPKEIVAVPFWILSFFLFQTALTQKAFLKGLSVALMAQIALGLFQIASGHSLGLHIFGEPHLASNLAQISKWDFNGFILMRPYGTWPHPNLFGAFCALSALLLGSWLPIAGTFLSGSRMAVLMILQKFNRPLLALAALFIALKTAFTWNLEAWSRFADIPWAFEILKQNPWGTGQGGYLQELAQVKAPLLPWEAQPVHNSILLFVTEWGFFSLLWLALAAWVIKNKTFQKEWILPIAFGFMLDHFWVSLPQGAILSALALASLITSPQSRLLKIHQTT